MKKIYICSPCRGDYDTNIENAITYCRQVFQLGYMPIAPHIYFTRFLSDDTPGEREVAMKAGSELLLRCSEVWVFGLDNPSEGMKAEIALAIRKGIPVKDGPEEILKRTTAIHIKGPVPADELRKLAEAIRNEPVRIMQDGPTEKKPDEITIRIIRIPGGRP